MVDRTAIIVRVCDALSEEGTEAASRLIRHEYPFTPIVTTKRAYAPAQVVPVFVRDGFIDRYSGTRLVFPPVLHIIHASCPDVFPHHPAWRTDATHPAFNDLAATIDHIVPVTRGGADDAANWVTTSMARNFAKSNFSLEELGWVLHAPGSFSDWDGLLHWYVAFLRPRPQLKRSPVIRRWFRAAEAVIQADA